MSNESAIMTMTARGPDRILSEGGSQAWVLNPANARKHDYLIALQNQHNGRWGGATEPHGTAFLIGKIKAVVQADDPDAEEGRYKIEISNYARINIPLEWKGRNPVRYVTLDKLGIDPSTLDFHPMPAPERASAAQDDQEAAEPFTVAAGPAPTSSAADDRKEPLTIPEAKERLAATLGVRSDQIRITIDA